MLKLENNKRFLKYLNVAKSIRSIPRILILEVEVIINKQLVDKGYSVFL